MEQKKEKGLRIRSCLTGAIWLALVFSTVISQVQSGWHLYFQQSYLRYYLLF